MTVLVTGGAGYIGSQTAHELADAGETVLVFDNLSAGFAWALPDSVSLVVGNVGDQELLASLFASHQVEAIIHFAGSIVVPESVRDPLGYYQNNTCNSRALIAAAVKAHVRYFIFSSTAAVYGNPARTPIDENSALTPISPYGWSKLMTEVMLQHATAAHRFNHVILRYFNVAGADPKLRTGQSTPNATHLIKVAAQTALGLRTHLEVFGNDYPTPDGTCIRDYIHVADLARAHCAALSYLRDGGRSVTLNCGYGRGYSVSEVIAAVNQAIGRNLRVRMAPRRPGDPASLVADTGRIHETLRWRPKFDTLQTIVTQALAWERHLEKQQKTSLKT